jgi:hypothetical protein
MTASSDRPPSQSISAAGLECRGFNQYTAALATFTVDCLGTIAPDSFRVEGGLLERTFERCVLDPAKLADIDAILSLQRRAAMLPNVRMHGRRLCRLSGAFRRARRD